MALAQIRYSSRALACITSVNVFLPERDWQFSPAAGGTGGNKDGHAYRVLYLLHGLGDNETGWQRNTAIESLLRDTDVAVVMPGVGHSFYANERYGQRFFDFVADELPAYLGSLLPLSRRREDTFVCGNSMGGYGAFKLALTYPDRFARAAALSGVLDIQRFLDTFRQDGFDPRAAFGEDLCVEGTPDDLLWLLARRAEEGADLPELLSVCGTDDMLLEESRRFASVARELGVPLDYRETPGEHLWTSWQRQLPDVLSWLLA